MPDVILIQESKKEEFDALFIKSPWSSKDIGRDRVESFGTLGGMLIMLDRKFCLDAWSVGGDFSITRWAHERFPVGRTTRGTHRLEKELPLQDHYWTDSS
ncbi:hypothetical protein E5676_scaffold265G002040 [Cucumis melo var. makuwa]|uniref:Uncharacterized protein n=1 Tax=Cucumis melo var. makuwa TaxID=1194695 RepID=A0A5D3CCG0_CUCMM|nr:hypothetical protein E6C27_scaffold63G001120 [Cucumis melo var. makuwa]TYK08056.1 hypothetical protein E5676_scaffold265G002040 [Cucumis melo var. makuwa]